MRERRAANFVRLTLASDFFMWLTAKLTSKRWFERYRVKRIGNASESRKKGDDRWDYGGVFGDKSVARGGHQ